VRVSRGGGGGGGGSEMHSGHQPAEGNAQQGGWHESSRGGRLGVRPGKERVAVKLFA
jgi:hypothetical protein